MSVKNKDCAEVLHMSKQSQSTHFQLSPPKRSKKTSLQKLESTSRHSDSDPPASATACEHSRSLGQIQIYWRTHQSASQAFVEHSWPIHEPLHICTVLAFVPGNLTKRLGSQRATAFNSWNYVDATGSLALDKQTYCASGASAHKTFSQDTKPWFVQCHICWLKTNLTKCEAFLTHHTSQSSSSVTSLGRRAETNNQRWC